MVWRVQVEKMPVHLFKGGILVEPMLLTEALREPLPLPTQSGVFEGGDHVFVTGQKPEGSMGYGTDRPIDGRALAHLPVQRVGVGPMSPIPGIERGIDVALLRASDRGHPPQARQGTRASTLARRPKEDWIGTYKAKFTRHLDAPVEDVWDFVATHDSWREPFVKDVEPLDEGDLEVGTRYQNVASLGPFSFRLVNEIIRLEPPHHMAWTDVSQKGPIRTVEGSYDLEPADGGTKFTLSLHGETRGIPSAIAQLMTERFIAPKLLSQLEEGVSNHTNR